MGEFDLIAWIRARSGGGTPAVPLGIGDDCAIVRVDRGSDLLVTTDMLMDGRHFRLGEHTPEQVGYKALAVNLSDIAAMAGAPRAAFVAVALPRDAAVAIARGLYAGMAPLLDRFGVVLAGGDTNAWDGPLVVTVTLLGETVGPRVVRRSGARAGDAIFVTGPLGGSLASGRHLRPEPRVDEALKLAVHVPIHAMIDLSDGLASDLGHILLESGGLGADLVAEAIPIHPDAEGLGRLDVRTPLARALGDGEDFELCFTIPPEYRAALIDDVPDGVDLHWIGTVAVDPGIRIHLPDGTIRPHHGRGFDHLAAPR